jgi:hypothetical protein
MSLFDKFLKAISVVLPSGLTDKKARLLAQLDPHRIDVENVRSILGVSHAEAVKILETAVRQGVFEKQIDVRCPDGSIGASATTEDALPPTVPCWTDEEGFPEKVMLATHSLPRTISYRLHESNDTYKRTA